MTHGAEDGTLFTGIPLNFSIVKENWQDFLAGHLTFTSTKAGTYVAFRPTYLQKHNGRFPDSLVYIDACYSLGEDSLPRHLFPLDVQVVLGWTGETDRIYAFGFFEDVLKNQLSVSNAFYSIPREERWIIISKTGRFSTFEMRTKYTQEEADFFLTIP